MNRPRNRSAAVPAAAAGLVLLLLAGPGRAEPLLTAVTYVDGAVTYSLYRGDSGGNYSSSLRAGMALPAPARVNVANGSKAMLNPVPAVRYLMGPATRAVNETFGLHFTVLGAPAFAYQVNVDFGTMLGDVAGTLRNVDNRIGTPRGIASSSGGHFLVAVRGDGTTKFAVLHGLLVVSVPGDKDYRVGADQELTLLSESARLRAQGAGAPETLTPEQRALGQVGGAGIVLSSLADDPEAVSLLAEPFPTPNFALFAKLPGMVEAMLLPGQESFDYNPEHYIQQLPFPVISNEPNPGNSEGNPPVSPIFP